MKRQLLLLLLTTFAFPLLTQAGTVTINTALDTVFGPMCPPPQLVDFMISGNTTGYTNGTDSVTIYIDFGDGNDTTFKSVISPTFWAYPNHNYTISGQFTVTYIAIGPDLAADTLIRYNEVFIGDTCGSIDGQVFYDDNGDCIFNSGDSYLPFIQVSLLQNNQVIAWDWTDSNGEYWFDVPINFAYDIELANLSQYGYNATCPSSGTINVPNAPSSGNDFAVECLNGFDLTGNAGGGSVPGQDIQMGVNAFNSTCQLTSGIVKLVFDDPNFSYFTGSAIPAPTYIDGDTLAWNFSNMSNNWNNYFGAYLRSYTSTSAQIGDTVCVTLIVEPITGDNYPDDNVKIICIPVTSSYDPNNKTVTPLGTGSQGRIAQNTDLTYTLNFQNTGTALAYNIYLLDTLQDTELDLNAIYVLGASHNVTSVDIIGGNVLKFRFDNIFLPDSGSNMAGSQGWVMYRIDQQQNLPNGTQINNNAGIFFDWNDPVITNTTLNTIDINLGSGVQQLAPAKGQVAIVYPNPTSTVLNINFGDEFNGEVMLVDLVGKVLSTQLVSTTEMQLDVHQLPAGIYLLIINGENNIQREKIVVTR